MAYRAPQVPAAENIIQDLLPSDSILSMDSVSADTPSLTSEDFELLHGLQDAVRDNPEVQLHRHFRLSSVADEKSRQILMIEKLELKYGQECLLHHQFDWVTYSSGPIREEFLPVYTYKAGCSVRDIWEEWTNGLDGGISVQQLNSDWGARWKRNTQGLKTEASRRKHVINLVIALSQKPGWTTEVALKFLEDEYPIPGPGPCASATAFCRHLQNTAKGGLALQEIMDRSNSYCTQL